MLANLIGKQAYLFFDKLSRILKMTWLPSYKVVKQINDKRLANCNHDAIRKEEKGLIKFIVNDLGNLLNHIKQSK